MSKRKEIPNVMGELQGLGRAVTPSETEARPTTPTKPAQRQASSLPRRAKNRTPKSRLVGRATYDIGEELKNAILNESVDLGVPASQLARYLLLYAWDFYVEGDIPAPTLSRSTSPKFRNNIEFE